MAPNQADARAQSAGLTVNDTELQGEINKRLTLNWLIQGAAQHAGMTVHHLVRDELAAINPKLLRLYDQCALINLLQYWGSDAVLLLGWPPRFWRRASTKPGHPFFGHPLLSRHGGMLAATARQRALDRCKEKGLSRLPILFGFKAVSVIVRLQVIEARHSHELVELAKKSAAMVWGIGIDRLNATLTQKVAFGNLSKSRTLRGLILRGAAAGYGGVTRHNDSLQVVGKAINFYLLAKELVKGTAELICLHGLNNLNDNMYEQVVGHTDRIEWEPWMLQTGGEFWRRLLALLPDGWPLAEILMKLARLPASSLESLMLAVIEHPERAREQLADLGRVTLT